MIDEELRRLDIFRRVSEELKAQGSGGGARDGAPAFWPKSNDYVQPKSVEDQLRQKIKELEEENSRLKNELANIKGGYR